MAVAELYGSRNAFLLFSNTTIVSISMSIFVQIRSVANIPGAAKFLLEFEAALRPNARPTSWDPEKNKLRVEPANPQKEQPQQGSRISDLFVKKPPSRQPTRWQDPDVSKGIASGFRILLDVFETEIV